MNPKYLNVASDLKKRFRIMRHEGISKLPSEAELAEKYDCSRQTIRCALASLEAEGLIVKRHGSGSYLSGALSLRSRQIAVIVPDRNEYIYPHIIRDMQNVFSAKGYDLCCYNTDNRFLTERRILEKLLEAPPAGIILEAISNVIPCMNTEVIRRIGEAGIPLVYLHNAYDIAPDAVLIGQDNFSGGYQLVKHLYAKGHRNIAGIMKCDVISGIERYRGCVQASIDLELDFQEGSFFWFSSENRKMLLENDETVLRFFVCNLPSEDTAIVCYNDEIAFRLIRMLSMHDISVPDGMAVVSFDNSYYCTAGDIGITSLGHAPHAVGTAAANALLSLISGRRCGSIILPWTLNERRSG